MIAKERATVEQEEMSYHYDSAKAAIRQATKKSLLPTSVYGKEGEKVNLKLEIQQLSRKDQVSISRLRRSHEPEILAPQVRQALGTVCRK